MLWVQGFVFREAGGILAFRVRACRGGRLLLYYGCGSKRDKGNAVRRRGKSLRRRLF